MENIQTIKQRDSSIDLLRAIGLLLVILAHIQPPHLLFEIRTFDVVLMVFLSGLSFSLSSKSIFDIHEYCIYLWKRFKKLILPTWIVLAVFFAIFNVAKKLFNISTFSFSGSDYLFSFALIAGVGVVWVMRIYFTMSAIAPILQRVRLSNKRILLFLPIFLAAYEICTIGLEKHDSLASVKIIETIFIYTIGYAFCFFLGMRYRKFEKREVLILTAINVAAFVVTGCLNGFADISEMKYPPQVYYLSYGIIVTILLIELSNVIFIRNWADNPVVSFLSKNSLMVYLLHLFPLKAVEFELVKINWGGGS